MITKKQSSKSFEEVFEKNANPDYELMDCYSVGNKLTTLGCLWAL